MTSSNLLVREDYLPDFCASTCATKGILRGGSAAGALKGSAGGEYPWPGTGGQWTIGECAHMADDWLQQGIDFKEDQRRCQPLADMIETIGLGMAVEKNKYGTSVKFLGVIIDTVAMRLRIDDLQSLGTRLLLQEVRVKLRKLCSTNQATSAGWTWYMVPPRSSADW